MKAGVVSVLPWLDEDIAVLIASYTYVPRVKRAIICSDRLSGVVVVRPEDRRIQRHSDAARIKRIVVDIDILRWGQIPLAYILPQSNIPR